MGIEIASQNQQFREFLRESGGSREMVVNGSVTPVEFIHQPTVESWLTEIKILLLDSAITDTGKFGNDTALTNGFLLEHKDKDDNVKFAWNDGDPIKTNADLCRTIGTCTNNPFEGKLLAVTLTTNYHPIHLVEDDKVVLTIRDNMTIESLTCQIAGYIYGS